jgi:hypothetical protein
MFDTHYGDTALLQNVGNYLPADTACMSGDMKLRVHLTTLLHVTLRSRHFIRNSIIC